MPRPRQRARPIAQETSATNLFSSVFSFVAKEVESFVSSATGRPPRDDEEFEDEDEEYENEEDEADEQPQASSSRSQPRGTKTGRQRETSVRDKTRRIVHKTSRQAVTDDRRTQREQSRSRRHNSYASDSREVEHKRTKHVASSPLTPRPALRRQTSPDHEKEELVHSDESRTPSPTPSLVRMRHKKSAFTMPGALYDRTSSLEPTPEPEYERSRVVRFAPEVSVSPSRNQSETPRSSRYYDENEAGPSSGPSTSSVSGRETRDTSRIESSSEVDEGTPTPPMKRPSRRNSFVQESIRLRSAETNPNISLLLPRSPVAGAWSSPSKGKGKAPASPDVIVVDSEEETSSDEDRNRTSQADLSVRTRVKGKERELHDARQQERKRELQSTANDEERTRDKARIRALEEELRKLREELAKRPAAPQPYFVPPPPPPPPPPIPLMTSRPHAGQPTTAFADVRASLRHAGTPVEKPINPAAYGGPSVRKGQPAINVGADMMAAFLNELKSHRLRRVGTSGGDGLSTGPGARSQPAIRAREVGDVGNRSEVVLRPREIEDVGNRSEVLPGPSRDFVPSASERPVNVRNGLQRSGTEAQVNGKRKYADTSYDATASKRRVIALPGDSSGDSSISLASSSGSSSRQSNSTDHFNQRTSTVPSARPNRPPISDTVAGLRPTADARTRTDMTTPSLCSDNDQDSGSHEGQSPPTPPPSASVSLADKGSRSEPISVDKAVPSRVHDVEEVEEVDKGYHSGRLGHSSRPVSRVHEAPLTSETFARRLPSSPRLADSPRKPRRPARPRVIQNIAPPEEDGDEDENPLSISYSVMDAPEHNLAGQQEQEEGQAADLPEPPPRRFPIRPPPGMFKPDLRQSTRPSRLPIRQASQKSKAAKSSARSSLALKSALRRRDSLDTELRRAETSYEADALDDDDGQENETFAGRGTRSRKHGFVAYGGAGGPSAVMGSGTVEGLEDLNDSDEEMEQEEEPRRLSRRRVRRASGTGRL